MKTWQITLVAIFAFFVLALEALGAACFGWNRFMSTTRTLAAEERQQQVNLQYVRERLAVATLYKETVEDLSDKGDYNGVLLAEAKYQRALSSIDARYPDAAKAKVASH